MASNDIGDWYRNIPQITKYWFTGSVILPLIGKIGLVSPASMVLDYASLVNKFQVWMMWYETTGNANLSVDLILFLDLAHNHISALLSNISSDRIHVSIKSLFSLFLFNSVRDRSIIVVVVNYLRVIASKILTLILSLILKEFLMEDQLIIFTFCSSILLAWLYPCLKYQFSSFT